MPTSLELYRTLHQLNADIQAKLLAAGYKKQFHINIFLGSDYHGKLSEPSISIHDSEYSDKVEGKDLWEVVHEFLRRVGFAEAQKALQLAPPTYEAEPEVPLPPAPKSKEEESDEIPF